MNEYDSVNEFTPEVHVVQFILQFTQCFCAARPQETLSTQVHHEEENTGLT